MPIVRTYRCDLPGCTQTAEAPDGQIPPGWIQVTLNEAGTSTLVFHNRADLVTWCGATLIPQTITVQQARTVLAEWRASHPKP
jgi:hypothetical protein